MVRPKELMEYILQSSDAVILGNHWIPLDLYYSCVGSKELMLITENDLYNILENRNSINSILSLKCLRGYAFSGDHVGILVIKIENAEDCVLFEMLNYFEAKNITQSDIVNALVKKLCKTYNYRSILSQPDVGYNWESIIKNDKIVIVENEYTLQAKILKILNKNKEIDPELRSCIFNYINGKDITLRYEAIRYAGRIDDLRESEIDVLIDMLVSKDDKSREIACATLSTKKIKWF